MSRYRVEIGYYEEARAKGLLWEDARAIVEAQLLPFLSDDCETCKEDGARAILMLRTMRPGNFDQEVDGLPYRIVEE